MWCLFLRVLRCFSSPRLLQTAMNSLPGDRSLRPAGFPHSDTCGSLPVWRLPAALRSLPRPSSPADTKASTVRPFSLRSFEHTTEFGPRGPKGLKGEIRVCFLLENLNPMQLSKIRLVLQSAADTPKGHVGSYGTRIRRLTLLARMSARLCRLGLELQRSSLKEVIQPQVPLRLPCYDFTPVTVHSFGGSLTWLGHRLLEQTTSMV